MTITALAPRSYTKQTLENQRLGGWAVYRKKFGGHRKLRPMGFSGYMQYLLIIAERSFKCIEFVSAALIN